MKKNFLFISAITSITMLIGVFAVMKYSVPIAAAFVPVVLVFLILATLLVWRRRKGDLALDLASSDKSRTALKWLFVPFGISAVVALVMSLQAGWTIGDTIGAIFFGIFALLVAYELLRRRAGHPR